jgi:hypothetical protein
MMLQRRDDEVEAGIVSEALRVAQVRGILPVSRSFLGGNTN